MIDGIKIISPCGLNEGFCVGSWVRHEKPKEGYWTHRPKRCIYEDTIVQIFSEIKIIKFDFSNLDR